MEPNVDHFRFHPDTEIQAFGSDFGYQATQTAGQLFAVVSASCEVSQDEPSQTFSQISAAVPPVVNTPNTIWLLPGSDASLTHATWEVTPTGAVMVPSPGTQADPFQMR